MLNKPSDEQRCYPGSNLSCIRAQYSVGAQVGLYLLFMFDILLNILGNSVVILSIGHFKQLHSPSNVLVLSLSVTDLLVGITVVPFSMTRAIQGCWFYGETFCQIHTSFDFFLTASSIFHLVCIAVDRYEAVCNPLRYSNNITMSVACFMVLVCWLMAALYSYGLIFSKINMAGMEDYMEYTYCLGSCNVFFNSLWLAINPMILFFLPCTVMVGLYMQIFIAVKKQLRKIEEINQNINAEARFSKQSEHKAAKTLGIVLGVFIFCFIPLFLSTFIDPYVGFSTPETVYEVFAWLSYFNSTMNPIIYALFYPWFRKCFKLIVTLKIFKQNSSDINVFCNFPEN